MVTTDSLTVAPRKSSAHGIPPEKVIVSQTTSSQRLYDLDKSLSPELDKLLRDKEYIDGLLDLPENELIQLVNYLNDVGFPSEINLADN